MRSTRRKTLEEFVADAKAIHGNDYDYTLIDNYTNNRTAVVIRCKTCGLVFSQTPHGHLNGQGCPKCGIKKYSERKRGKANHKLRKMIFGVATNDYPLYIKNDKHVMFAYTKWRNILQRCYSEAWKNKKPTYKNCSVCDEWLFFSNFLKWFNENYHEGYDIDKDILVKGNKVYSPQTCCCVPSRINGLLINRTNGRGSFPIGVSLHNGKYTGAVSTLKGNSIYIGVYNTPKDAFYAYKRIKENYIKEVAQEYYDKGLITERVYNALMKYEVEITD